MLHLATISHSFKVVVEYSFNWISMDKKLNHVWSHWLRTIFEEISFLSFEKCGWTLSISWFAWEIVTRSLCVSQHLGIYPNPYQPSHLLALHPQWDNWRFQITKELIWPEILRLDSNIESKSLNNTYLNIIKIFNKLFK